MPELDEIIKGCRKNNRQAQAALYQWLAPKLLGLCLRYFDSRAEAEDAMQDSMVKIFDKINTYRAEGSFEGWARRLSLNLVLNRIKSNKKIVFERNLEVVELTDFTAPEIQTLEINDIVSCLNQLPTGYRTILNLFLMEDFSHHQIAEQLGISESTSRSQYTRARQALAKLVKEKLKKEETRYA